MKLIVCILILFLPFLGMAQPTLSLKGVIDTTLRNSYDIQIATNNAEVGKINNTFGVAGGLPSINGSVTDNQSYIDVKQKLNSGAEIKKSNSSSNNLASGVSMGLVLFNGFKIMATKHRLEFLQNQSQLLLNLQLQNSIAGVMTKYYDIVRQQEYSRILSFSSEVAKKKLDIVSAKRSVGLANDADLLQAQIDLNNTQQAVRNQELVVVQAKTDLLQLMSQQKYYEYTIQDTIVADRSVTLDVVLGYLKQNPQYLSSEMQVRINEQVVREVGALRYPTLRLTSGYNFNRTESTAGLTLLNQNYGPQFGVSLQIPIYNGNAYNVQKQTAQYNYENAKLSQQSLLNTLSAGANRTFEAYRTALEQTDEQRTNLQLARQLIDLVLQRFQVSQATILDLKAAQQSFETTGYQLVNLEFASKVAEIELKRLMFQLSNQSN